MPRADIEAQRTRMSVGIVLMLIGLVLVVLGIPGLIPLSVVGFGPVVIKEISERSAYLLGAGVILILIGAYLGFQVKAF